MTHINYTHWNTTPKEMLKLPDLALVHATENLLVGCHRLTAVRNSHGKE
jgi:hypothetical protein